VTPSHELGEAFTPSDGNDHRVWRLPNGRYIYRERPWPAPPGSPAERYQAPNANWWHTTTTLEDAVRWFANYKAGE
jgi:hypothetical protein